MLGVMDGSFTSERRVTKALRDTVYQEGTTPAQTSQRVKGLAVKLYLLPKPFNYGVSLLDGSQSPDLMPRFF